MSKKIKVLMKLFTLRTETEIRTFLLREWLGLYSLRVEVKRLLKLEFDYVVKP